MGRKLHSPVEKVVERINLVLDGWGRYFKCRVLVFAVHWGICYNMRR